MGRERPTCAKLHAPLTFACYRGAPTAHEVSILWFIASVVAAANFFRGLLADPGPDEASLFLRGVVVLLSPDGRHRLPGPLPESETSIRRVTSGASWARRRVIPASVSFLEFTPILRSGG